MPFKMMQAGDEELVRTPKTMSELSDPGAVQNRAFAARRMMADTMYDTGSLRPVQRQAYERKIMADTSEEQAGLDRTSQETNVRNQFVRPAEIQGKAQVDAARSKMMGDVATAEASRTSAQLAAISERFSSTPTGGAVIDKMTGQATPITSSEPAPLKPTLTPTDIPGVFMFTNEKGETKVEDLREKNQFGGVPPLVGGTSAPGAKAGTDGAQGTDHQAVIDDYRTGKIDRATAQDRLRKLRGSM